MKRKTFLVIDNVASHINGKEPKRQEIKVTFVPPNVMMDHGVIETLKKKNTIFDL